MAEYSGLTNASDTVNTLITGGIKVLPVLCDTNVSGLESGQVLQWDGTGHNFQAYTSGCAKQAYAVLLEDAGTIATDSHRTAIVAGEVNLSALDSTAQADSDIIAALLGSGIIARTAEAVV